MDEVSGAGEWPTSNRVLSGSEGSVQEQGEHSKSST